LLGTERLPSVFNRPDVIAPVHAERVAKARKHGSNPIRSAENDEACNSFKITGGDNFGE
jgi:hypothetical protein